MARREPAAEKLLLEELSALGACDISDALVALGYPHGGFLADISPIPSPSSTSPSLANSAARISTVLFTTPPLASQAPTIQSASSASADTQLPVPARHIPAGTPYADHIRPDTAVLISQPAGQTCAVMGDVMATRMSGALGARAFVVDGRVRDVAALGRLGVPTWSRGISTVGAGKRAVPVALDVPVTVGEVAVLPNDIIVLDPSNGGAVVVPDGVAERVVSRQKTVGPREEKVLEHVEGGGTVEEAFRLYRS